MANHIIVRVTHAQHREIQEAAMSTRLTISGFVRHNALRAARLERRVAESGKAPERQGQHRAR